jgi:hypothetical protein
MKTYDKEVVKTQMEIATLKLEVVKYQELKLLQRLTIEAGLTSVEVNKELVILTGGWSEFHQMWLNNKEAEICFLEDSLK